jgi:hypothetical protein
LCPRNNNTPRIEKRYKRNDNIPLGLYSIGNSVNELIGTYFGETAAKRMIPPIIPARIKPIFDIGLRGRPSHVSYFDGSVACFHIFLRLNVLPKII